MPHNKLKEELIEANNLDEVKEILKDHPEIDPEWAWREIENHRSSKKEKLDNEELDAVNRGANRDWKKDGCAATYEWDSWCWSNDNRITFDVTYSNFWRTCPDGHEHVINDIKVCTRCGFSAPYDPDIDNPR